MEWIVFIGFLLLGFGLCYWVNGGFDFGVIFFGLLIGVLFLLFVQSITILTGLSWTKTVTVSEYDFEYVNENFVMWNDGVENQVESFNKFDVRLGDENKIEVVKTVSESDWFIDSEKVEYVIVIRKP
jgi:hypothetical protein